MGMNTASPLHAGPNLLRTRFPPSETRIRSEPDDVKPASAPSNHGSMGRSAISARLDSPKAALYAPMVRRRGGEEMSPSKRHNGAYDEFWRASVPLSAVLALIVGIGFPAPRPSQSAPAPEIVKNGKRPVPPAGFRFSLEPLWTAGGETSPEGGFADVTAVAVDPAGAAFVLDGKDCRVAVFDSGGKFVRAFGRKGQGPGELNGPIGIAVTPAGEVMVEESLNRRLSYFTREGKFLRQRSTAQGMGMGLAGLVMDGRGRMAGRSLFMDGGKIGFEIRIYDADLKPGAALARIEMANLGGLKIDPLTQAPGLVVAPDERGRLFLGSVEGYRIRVLDFDGRVSRTVERDYDPVPVRKEDLDRLYKIIGGMPATGGLNLKEMIQIPDVYPAYLMFVVDPDGRILVRTHDRGKDEKEHLFDVFDAQGRYVHRFASRADFLLWRNGRLFGTEEDPDGFVLLKCFRVVG
jgi:hypothetical protein